jgi:hypothetical protein
VATPDFDSMYDVQLTGREIYWLIYLASKELKRLEHMPGDLAQLKKSQIDDMRKPITEAFNKLIVIG